MICILLIIIFSTEVFFAIRSFKCIGALEDIHSFDSLLIAFYVVIFKAKELYDPKPLKHFNFSENLILKG